ncbi:carboxylesterase/lipase family protein [Kineococcus rubinsiae]|uniref:carboxylesterase/lipase family protein n=1 Tax=Kineococcus rubinsiae TaxID=2609562 RepID=UPI0014311746|nr:carboxylesterase family protein [Kineococcus rubinsiae]NIZ92150.1 carboxylesterase/lipase family protein [Kineococcus rubinsiae]
MSRVVVTAAGGVRGREPVDGVVAFRGIPYAAPPVGPLRLQPPAPVTPWSGVRDARQPSPVAPQERSSSTGWTPASGDDYLTLDVFAPADFPRAAPVLVWIHGGSWTSGAGSLPMYEPRAWVRRGLVVVSINYRLGFEGFGAVEGAVDNRGLRDQVAALRWVAENVAAFGGDPARVTVAGESAGAGSVAALLCAPSARGLFSRAIAQSIPGETFTVGHARAIGARVARAARVPATLAGFAGLAPVRLLEATRSVVAEFHADPSSGMRSIVDTLFNPVVDGDFLPVVPFEGPGAGGDPSVALLVNHNSDEWNLFSGGRLAERPRGTADLPRWARAGRLDDAQFARFAATLPGAGPLRLTDALLTDSVFAEPSRRFARAHADAGGSTHRSLFTWRSPALAGRLGAAHAVDLPFVFGNPQGLELLLHAVPVLPLLRRVPGLGPRVPGVWPTPASAALSRRMVDAWVAFATTGEPGWPALAPDATPVKVWGSADDLVEEGPDPRRDLWREVRFAATGG